MSQISEHLNSSHKKSDFSCGKEMLDIYLHKQALQDVKRKLSTCFVVIEADDRLIKAYYTLSNSSIPSGWIPERLRNKLPKSYQAIPATLIGRLAIDNKFQRQGLGKLILVDALKRCYELSKTIGSFAIVVDPIDQEAESFYEKFGFIKLPDSGKMFLPMTTISQLFEIQ
jgi:predicted GNAT family N-acyltransferase